MKLLSWLSPLFFAAAFLCFVGNVGQPGWVLANISGFFSLWTPAVGWLLKGHTLPGVTSLYLRLGLVIYACYGWWSFGYQPPSKQGELFVFGLVPFLAGLQYLEIQLVERYVSAAASPTPPPSDESRATDTPEAEH